MFDELQISKYILYGAGEDNWYEETRKTIVDIFGEEQCWFICQLLAATSINSTLKSNIALFSKALYQWRTGQKFTGYVPVMLMQLERLKKGEPMQGRKINNFARAMYGNPNAVVVDTWIMRAFLPERARKRKDKVVIYTPTKKDYDNIEDWIIKKAYSMDMQPRELCSTIWGGIRKMHTGKNNPTRYCDILRMKFSNPLFARGNLIA